MTSPLSRTLPFRLPGPLAVATDVLVPPAVAGLAALGATVRKARVFHPRGDAFAAVLEVRPGVHEAAGGWGVPLLDEDAEHEAVVRLSRGAGLPRPLPDVLGLAMRLPDIGGPSQHQDLLVNTAGSAPILRRVFLPALEDRGPRHYSSVLPYAAGGGHVLLGASPTGEGGFTLLVSRGFGGAWEQWGELHLVEELPDTVSDELRFDPVTNTGGGLEPVGFLNALRRPAYMGSQSARDGR